MKKSIFIKMLYANPAINICIFFTVATMLDLILNVVNGITHDTYLHLGMRFIICSAIALSLMLFRYFEKLSLLAVLFIHAFICILIMLLSTWIWSFFIEVHPNSYRDAVRTIFIIYPVMIVGIVLIDAVQTFRANRILKMNIQK